MSDAAGSQDEVLSLIEQISTHWTLISDPLKFVFRYAPAIRRYLAALLKNPHDAEDVTQNFLVQMLQKPFRHEQVRGGRFRDYLKAILRNAAVTHLRRQNPVPGTTADLEHIAAPGTE